MRSSSVKVIFILLFVSAIFWELSCSDLQTEIRCWDTCPEYSYDIPETQIVIPVECGKAILFPSYDLRTYSELESVITEIGAVIDTIIFDRVQVSNFYCDEYDRAVLSDGIMHIHPCFRDAPQQHMSHSVVACFKGDVDSGVVDLSSRFDLSVIAVYDSMVFFNIEENKTTHPLRIVQQSQGIEYLHWIEPSFIPIPL